MNCQVNSFPAAVINRERTLSPEVFKALAVRKVRFRTPLTLPLPPMLCPGNGELGGQGAATIDNERAQIDHGLPKVIGELTDPLAAWGLHV
jgi:hypothetical protein